MWPEILIWCYARALPCDVVWDNCASKFKDTIQKLQNRACELILKWNRFAHTDEIHHELKLWKQSERRTFHTACMAYRCNHILVPHYLQNIYQPVTAIHQHNTRNATNQNLFIESSPSESGKGMFRKRSVILFNSLPANVKNAVSLPTFKRAYISFIQQT